MRGILGGGSQRSFITEDLATKLRLPVVREPTIAFNTFGSAVPARAQKLKVVEVPLRSQYDRAVSTIEAIAVTVICHDVAAPSADGAFAQHLRRQGKLLADDQKHFDAEAESGLGLLVGSDHLWHILTGEVIRCTEVEGLTALNATFRWTLQGPARQKAFLECGTHVMVCVLRGDNTIEEETTSDILQSFGGWAQWAS